MNRTALPVLAVALTVVAVALSAHGHGPDPTFSGPLWNQNQSVPFSWKSGQVPPAWMKPAIKAAAVDNNESMRSKAARFSYKAGASSKVSYGEPSGCGGNGIACMSRTAPSKYTVAFRKHGKVFDWGTLKWCQRYSSAPSGCYDVENIMLDELGHVQILQHHVNYGSNSDYGQAVVQTYSRTKPRAGWNKHSYGSCDVATLQKKYDVPNADTKISTCLDLETKMTLSKAISGGNVTFTATVKLRDRSAYGRLRNNPLAKRTVTLQKKAPGATSWTNVGAMAANGQSYVKTIADPSGTTNFRAKFTAADNEGLRNSTSPWVTF